MGQETVNIKLLETGVLNKNLRIFDAGGMIGLEDAATRQVVTLGYPEIRSFDGKWKFLSNLYETPIKYLGHVYKSSEAAFQAQKCPSRAAEFENLEPGKAKRLGRKVEIVPEWDTIKEGVMFDILIHAKFTNPYLAQMLLATGESTLIEGNYWHDTYWGVCDRVGQNRLGYILMRVRELIRYYDTQVTEFDEQLRRSVAAYAAYKHNLYGDEVFEYDD